MCNVGAGCLSSKFSGRPTIIKCIGGVGGRPGAREWRVGGGGGRKYAEETPLPTSAKHISGKHTELILKLCPKLVEGV